MTNPSARDLIQRLADELELWISDAEMEDIERAHCLVDEIRAYLATPEPAARPTDEELWELYQQEVGEPGDWAWVRDYARAVLARYGHQPPQPTPPTDPPGSS